MNKGLPDSALKYVEDLDFVKWVQSGFIHHNDYWREKSTNAAESDALNQAVKFVEQMAFKSSPINQQRKQQLFERINTSISEPSTINQKPKPKLYFIINSIALAACLLFLIAIYWPVQSYNDVSTFTAENKSHALPDNSQIILNAESHLSYDSKEFKKKRTLKLEGEAFFEVEKGKDFVVHTNLGRVEVLGTSFNVFARDDVFEVYCKTGKVKVSTLDGKSSLVLLPDEECHLFQNRIEKIERSFEPNEWVKGIFHYKESTLKNVLNELERQFDVQFDSSAIKNDVLYTGFFETKDLNTALESVLWPLGYNFEEMEKSVFRIYK